MPANLNLKLSKYGKNVTLNQSESYSNLESLNLFISVIHNLYIKQKITNKKW